MASSSKVESWFDRAGPELALPFDKLTNRAARPERSRRVEGWRAIAWINSIAQRCRAADSEPVLLLLRIWRLASVLGLLHQEHKQLLQVREAAPLAALHIFE